MSKEQITFTKKTSIEEIVICMEGDALKGKISFCKNIQNIGNAKYEVKKTYILITEMNIQPPYNERGLQQQAMKLIKNTYNLSEFHT